MVLVAQSEGARSSEEEHEFILELIRNHSLGGVWLQDGTPGTDKFMKKVKETADYSILIFTESLAYMGKEHLTQRIITLFEAAQYTNRISTVLHFGNPLVLERLPHISRFIKGGLSADGMGACLEVLAGVRESKGKPTYKVSLNK